MRRLLLIILFPFILLAKVSNPSAVTLTWISDPATTMTISWHTPTNHLPSYIHYREAGNTSWKTLLAQARAPSSYLSVHTVTLTNLSPNHSYEFRIDDMAKSYAFKTLSNDPQAPLRFAIGGDVYRSFALYKKMNAAVAKMDPQFVVLGGDIAYTLRSPYFIHTKKFEIKRWHNFFNEWSKNMVDRNGYMIPVLFVPGNHDVNGPPVSHVTRGTLYYDFIPLQKPGVTYSALDITSLFSLFILDTGHGTSVTGTQTEWLGEALAQRANVPLKIAVYHEAAYPAYYLPDSRNSKKIRQYWTPLFDQYHLTLAFENDNHTYKRTHPIKNEQIDPAGTLYLGDGAWGVDPRRPQSPSKLWYLAKSQQINHFYFLDYAAPQLTIQSYDIEGKIIENITTHSLSTVK
ncbi:MAG: hypothetical protein ChlgKO_02490 [Chlamydiales bacterium]